MRFRDLSADVFASDLWSCGLREEGPIVPFQRLKIADGLREIVWLQFNADALAAHAGGTIDFAANAKEWRQNRIAGVAPQVDASLDHVELQRRNMALIVDRKRTRLNSSHY